jgi:hypothetical protein
MYGAGDRVAGVREAVVEVAALADQHVRDAVSGVMSSGSS